MAVFWQKITSVKDIPKLEKETDDMICKFKNMLSNYQSQKMVVILKELLELRTSFLLRIQQYDKFYERNVTADGVEFMEILRLKLQHCLIETQYSIDWEYCYQNIDEMEDEAQSEAMIDELVEQRQQHRFYSQQQQGQDKNSGNNVINNGGGRSKNRKTIINKEMFNSNQGGGNRFVDEVQEDQKMEEMLKNGQKQQLQDKRRSQIIQPMQPIKGTNESKQKGILKNKDNVVFQIQMNEKEYQEYMKLKQQLQ